MSSTAAHVVVAATLTSLLDGLGQSLAESDETRRLAALGLPPPEPLP
jgi:hypothetical protein